MGGPTSKVDRVVVAGPLAPFAEGFQARLEELGYTVLTAEHGGQGLELYERSKEEIVLVLLDPSTGEIEYTNAGHNPGILLKVDKSMTEPFDT